MLRRMMMFSAMGLVTGLALSQPTTMVYELRCNRQISPVNINDQHPAFSWKIRSTARNYIQTAFKIIISGDSLTLSQNKGNLWNSGKVKSDQSQDIIYKGMTLGTYEKCWWKVKVWGNHSDSSNWSKPAVFRTSFMDDKDWKGEWIGSDLVLNDLQKKLKAMPDFNMETEDSNWAFVQKLQKMPKEEENAPAVYLRKEFRLVKKVKSAYATVSGLGFYELYVNGRRISNEYLNPAFSDYQKRFFYNTYDISKYLNNGINATGVILGNGWYNLIIPHALRYQTADYISPPALKMEITILYSDGTRESVVTDKTWKFSTDGPIRFNCILGGETYDNRKNIKGWDLPGFNDSQWRTALNCKAPDGKPDAQAVYPVQKVGENPARSITRREDTIVVDFGLELTGWARVRLRGRQGQVIRVSYPGVQSHTLGRYQTCKYILKGDSAEVFESRFSYNGFNKLEITGLDYKPDLSDFTAVSVNTNMPVTGSFECSNDTLNRLQSMIIQTIRNYIVHLPNDPTREKAGWSQDIENAFDATAYNFDCYSLYRKWQLDFLDIQHENGYVPPVVPGRFDGPTINGPWWGGMIVYQPWKIYEYYGDKRILEISYPAMKKYLDFLLSISNDYIVSWGLGDWLEPGTVRPIKTPVPLTSTLGFYYYTTIIEKTADILGKHDEKEKYHELAEKIKIAFNRFFYDPETGKYAKGSQASQLMSLYLGAVPLENEKKVREALIARIEDDNMHLSTGFVSTPFLLNGLNDLGYPEIAYTIATQNTYPSWFDMVFGKGHNVLNEHWDGGAVQMPSLGGGLGSWFYASLAGLKPDMAAPGFKHMLIDPAYNTPLKYVKASYQTQYGPVSIYWRKDKERLSLDLEIPENTKARVSVPTDDITDILENGRPVTGYIEIGFGKTSAGKPYLILGSGKYNFSMPFGNLSTL